MGLDITHEKLCLAPPEKGDFYTTDEWDMDCNVPLSHYAAYITDVEEWDARATIAVVQSAPELTRLRREKLLADHYLAMLTPDDSPDMMETMKRLVSEAGIEYEEVLALKEGISRPDGKRGEWSTYSFMKKVRVKGVYYEEAGYQRKGMNDAFYEEFRKHMLWGRREDFERAYECVGGDWYAQHWGAEAVERMKANFKRDFLDSFEEGRSLLCVCF
jgi:hypothetical protein